uniref:Uncharacterized protein n=1 Tax=Picea glauca TaxID=3330 RepID=A0A101M0S2_PICGL|nr:hypothetical protein ABT39_MTgene4231 [Picea glauca]QHR87879.1 hypothetical protein Q903MT_gene1891 [Picea sitchensis]
MLFALTTFRGYNPYSHNMVQKLHTGLNIRSKPLYLFVVLLHV